MTNVQVQRRDMAVLRILGSQRGLLFGLVIAEMVVVGLIGVGLRIVVGQALTSYVLVPTLKYFLAQEGMTLILVPQVSLSAILPPAISAFAVLILSSLKPANDASRTKVIHAINPSAADNIQIEALAQADLDALQKGPELADVAAAQAAMTAAEAAVTASVAQVVQAQAALDALLAGPSASDLVAAQINVEQARLALVSAQRGLDNVELLAPAPGTVTAVGAAVGTPVGGGTPIVILLDSTQLDFHTTNLSERDLAQVFPGQKAVVTLKAFPNDPIQATVVRIGLEAGAAVGDAATFPVILELGETELELRPGMTGRAEIRTGE